nr:capsid protein [Dicistroviridae sp.]
MELAPVDYDFMPQPAGVDINYVESLRSFLSRPYPIFSSTWTGDQASDTMLADIDLLEQYLNIPVIRGKLEGFNYLRAGIKVEIRINGTRFHYGLLTAGFFPLSNLKAYDSSQTHAYAVTMFPGVTLDPGSSEIGVFEVPYVHPHHFIQLTPNTLQAQQYRSLGTLLVKVLAPLQVVNQTTTPQVTFTIYASLVNPILNGFTAISLPSPLLVLQEQSGDSAIRVVPEANNFLATDINDVSVRAGMQGDNLVNKDEQYIGVSRSDMMFSNIFAKPNFVSVETWTEAHPPGTILGTLLVTPIVRVQPVSTYLYQLTTATRFWRGTLRYHVRIVASGFHSGRMMISWDSAYPASSSIVNVSNRLHLVVDLQQTTDLYFSVPYMQPEPWLDNESSSNGILTFSVLNSLATPSGEPSQINFYTWMYGGEDLEFAMPRTQIVPPFALNNVLQEQCATLPLNSSLFSNLLGSRSVPGKMVMGESLKSVAHLLQKMALINTTTATAQKRIMTVFKNSGTQAGAPAIPDPYSHLPYLSRMFVIMRGSVRYAPLAYTTADQATPVNEYSVGPCIWSDTNSLTIPEFGSLIVRAPTPNAMIEIPWYSDQIFTTTDSNNPGRFPAVITTARVPMSLSWYAGAGKDFMLAYLVPPPRG